MTPPEKERFMKLSAVQLSSVMLSAVQLSSVKLSAVRLSSVKLRAVRLSSVQCRRPDEKHPTCLLRSDCVRRGGFTVLRTFRRGRGDPMHPQGANLGGVSPKGYGTPPKITY